MTEGQQARKVSGLALVASATILAGGILGAPYLDATHAKQERGDLCERFVDALAEHKSDFQEFGDERELAYWSCMAGWSIMQR